MSLDLSTGASRVVVAQPIERFVMSRDGRFGVGAVGLRTERGRGPVLRFRLEDGTAQPLSTHGTDVTGSRWTRATRSSPPEAPIVRESASAGFPVRNPTCLGQQGSVHSIAFSPDGRWLATAGEAFAIHLWPVPDMSKVPLHRRPLDELLAVLHSHTNLRALPDPSSGTGFTLAPGPYPRLDEGAGMVRLRPLVAVVAFTLLAVGAAWAQEQRAAIGGIVRDTQGGAVPGVDVLATSATGLTLETVTEVSGTYRFATLPPGRYEVTARLAGFLPARVVNIDLALGVQLHHRSRLKPAGPNETVEVVNESPLVAVTQSAGATNLRNEQIEKMPRGRDFTSLAIQAAGTNDERKIGGISIDGASGAENRIIIDGVETTDTAVGTPGQFLVTDFVHELQIKSSGYSAGSAARPAAS